MLIIAASVLVVFSFQEAGTRNHAWGTALFLAPVIIGSFCWIALFGWEVLVAHFWETSIAAIFPLRLMKRRVFMAYVISTLLTGFPYFLIIYSLPLRFQVVNGRTPLSAGVSLLPLLFAAAIGSVIGGGVNGKKNNTFVTLLAGSCFMLIGTGLLSTVSDTESVRPSTYGYQVFVGLGFGLTVSTVSLAATIEADIRDSSMPLISTFLFNP